MEILSILLYLLFRFIYPEQTFNSSKGNWWPFESSATTATTMINRPIIVFQFILYNIKVKPFSMSFFCFGSSVTSKKSPNAYKSCPKMISLEKWKILTPLQKLPENVDDLAKIIGTTGLKSWNRPIWSPCFEVEIVEWGKIRDQFVSEIWNRILHPFFRENRFLERNKKLSFLFQIFWKIEMVSRTKKCTVVGDRSYKLSHPLLEPMAREY